MSIGDRIAKALIEAGKNKAGLAAHLGTKASTISGWVNDGRTPSADVILPICEFIGVSPSWLLSGEDAGPLLSPSAPSKKIPILGVIKAGIPILAEENFDGDLEVGDMQADFALRVSGDSMVYAGIYEDDYVLLKQADSAQSGQIVAATVDDGFGGINATLKYFVANGANKASLHPANPAYTDQPFTSQHKVIGVFVGLVRYEEPRINDVRSLQVQAEQLTGKWQRLIDEASSAGLDANDVEAIISMIRKVKG